MTAVAAWALIRAGSADPRAWAVIAAIAERGRYSKSVVAEFRDDAAQNVILNLKRKSINGTLPAKATEGEVEAYIVRSVINASRDLLRRAKAAAKKKGSPPPPPEDEAEIPLPVFEELEELYRRAYRVRQERYKADLERGWREIKTTLLTRTTLAELVCQEEGIDPEDHKEVKAALTNAFKRCERTRAALLAVVQRLHPAPDSEEGARLTAAILRLRRRQAKPGKAAVRYATHGASGGHE